MNEGVRWQGKKEKDCKERMSWGQGRENIKDKRERHKDIFI